LCSSFSFLLPSGDLGLPSCANNLFFTSPHFRLLAVEILLSPLSFKVDRTRRTGDPVL
jgi:hypothetical protein